MRPDDQRPISPASRGLSDWGSGQVDDDLDADDDLDDPMGVMSASSVGHPPPTRAAPSADPMGIRAPIPADAQGNPAESGSQPPLFATSATPVIARKPASAVPVPGVMRPAARTDDTESTTPEFAARPHGGMVDWGVEQLEVWYTTGKKKKEAYRDLIKDAPRDGGHELVCRLGPGQWYLFAQSREPSMPIAQRKRNNGILRITPQMFRDSCVELGLDDYHDANEVREEILERARNHREKRRGAPRRADREPEREPRRDRYRDDDEDDYRPVRSRPNPDPRMNIDLSQLPPEQQAQQMQTLSMSSMMREWLQMQQQAEREREKREERAEERRRDREEREAAERRDREERQQEFQQQQNLLMMKMMFDNRQSGQQGPGSTFQEQLLVKLVDKHLEPAQANPVGPQIDPMANFNQVLDMTGKIAAIVNPVPAEENKILKFIEVLGTHGRGIAPVVTSVVSAVPNIINSFRKGGGGGGSQSPAIESRRNSDDWARGGDYDDDDDEDEEDDEADDAPTVDPLAWKKQDTRAPISLVPDPIDKEKAS